MTLRHFEIFEAVSDNMNMTRAAEKLYVSQSAISQAISELEKFYNTRLFERISKKLYLTNSGHKLLSYARHIISMTKEAEEKVRAVSENGLIRIGASVTVGSYILPDLICRLKKNKIVSEVNVIENNTSEIESLILDNNLDIAVIEGEIKSTDIICKPIINDELVLIYGKEHYFSKKQIILPEDIENQDFIVREVGSGTREFFEDTLSVNNINWNAIWECNNTDTIKNAVIKNLGISVISVKAVENEIENNLLNASKIQGINFKRVIKIAYHKNKFITKQLKKIIDYCMNMKNLIKNR